MSGTDLSVQMSLEDAYREGAISEEEILAATAGGSFARVAAVSLVAAVRLADHRGGAQIYIPQPTAENTQLTQLVGQAAAVAIAREFSGETIGIPRLSGLRRLARNRRIDRLAAAGWSAAKIAMHFQLTERQVWRIRRAHVSGFPIRAARRRRTRRSTSLR